MTDASLPIQHAIVTALQASAAVKALIGDPARVYDSVPADAVFPYVTYDNDQVIPDDGVDCDNGTEIYVTLSAWSRAKGRVEAKRVAAAVADVLNAEITIEGHAVVTHDVQVQSLGLDPDGLTSHSLIVAHYQTQPAA